MSHGFVFPPAVWPPRIALDGHTLSYGHVPDTKLLLHIAVDNWAAIIFEPLAEDDKQYLFERLSDPDDSLTLARIRHITNSTVAAISGTTYQAAKRLAEHAIGNWFTFDGWCVMQGFDPNTAALHRIMAADFRFQMETLDSNDKNAVPKLINYLWPPSESQRAIEEEHSIMAGLIGAKPNTADGILR